MDGGADICVFIFIFYFYFFCTGVMLASFAFESHA
jgi:hypothetical protein